ncbi:site-specific integrase [Staphylococcus sp. IVB6238]|uniref:site-specific integrase n=1 Tax=unclassified Staphylococcus TaxID=91994 RepID=UPI0021D3A74F|nr:MULTISPECIES: site-specific integrase [unclassified Staphylococcus]UXR72070.1 site-specific integrase [Staphylococcus sp. IVB6240]UXR74378.1 site-specific integrase [Staphylococcus sp. IVB6238]
MTHNLRLSHNIYKDTKRGTYYFRITYYDKTNKRQFITRKGFKMRKDAVKKCNEIMDEIEGVGKHNRLPFDKLAMEYIEWYSARRKPSSTKALRTHINNHLVPYFCSMDVFNMTPQDIMKFQNKKMREKFSGDYLQKMHTYLVSVLNHAMKFHDLKQNVASNVGNFEVEKTKRLNYWTLEQYNKFYTVLTEIEQQAFFKLLFYSGARKGEVRALTWADINFEENYISINKTDYHGEVTSPKTKAGIRDVYMPQHMMDTLKVFKDWYKEHKVYKDDYVLFGDFFKAYSENKIDRWYSKNFKKANDTLDESDKLPRVVLHEWRHSHASLLVNLGVSVMIIAQRLGHSDTAEVYNRYGHLYPSTQKEIVKLL